MKRRDFLKNVFLGIVSVLTFRQLARSEDGHRGTISLSDLPEGAYFCYQDRKVIYTKPMLSFYPNVNPHPQEFLCFGSPAKDSPFQDVSRDPEIRRFYANARVIPVSR